VAGVCAASCPVSGSGYGCPVGGCDAAGGACTAAGQACYCTQDSQCRSGKCVEASGHNDLSCGAGCTGTGPADGFGCALAAPGIPATPTAAYTGFGYAPANFAPGSYTGDVPAAGTTVSCNVTYTSPGTAGASTWCGGTGPYVIPNVAQSGGPNVDVLVFNSLSVSAGVTLTLTGTNPIILAVYGAASISGTVNASASGTAAPGAGGDNAGYCGTGGTETADSLGGVRGGGGGGRAVAGGTGAGNANVNLVAGGTASGSSGASPLLGGCAGGQGGEGGTGAAAGLGGGAVQISAAVSLTISAGAAIETNGGAGAAGGGGAGGGGGGGSAGDILLQAPTVTQNGMLSANGGAGGAGGACTGCTPSTSCSGFEGGGAGGTSATSAAPGGGAAGSYDSSAGMHLPAPSACFYSNYYTYVGGGGGGGSYGYVTVTSGEAAGSGHYTCSTTLTPAPIPNAAGTACLCVRDSDCSSGHCGYVTSGASANGAGCGSASNCSGGTANLDGADCAEATSVYDGTCSTGNCDNVTSPTGACAASGTACWCTSDAQCAAVTAGSKCVSWSGCASGSCTGSGTGDGFNCSP